MENSISNDESHYDSLIARQIDQYKETEVMHDLPEIYDYWAKKYNSPNTISVIGYNNLIQFYCNYFKKSLHESNSIFLVSIGSGDCSIEIEIVKNLIAGGEKKFFFICLELSPILIEKARKKIDAEELGDIITVAKLDINKWQPKHLFAAVMAHHALHHFLNLEELFGLIKKNLAPGGRFVTCDIIGRNGHMRWPEALALTRGIWEKIPRKYKFHHQFGAFDDYFENWDCSNEGFEGIRAQDILPLLVKLFSFEVFYSFGNLIDPFIDRCYGPNYDPKDPIDRSFIDYIQELNEELISSGILKPTSMTAVMVNEPVPEPAVYKHWTPAFAIRDPERPAPAYDIAPLLANIPFHILPEDNPLVLRKTSNYSLDRKITFTNDPGVISGEQYLKYGWGKPESGFTWSICEDAGLIIPLKKNPATDLLLTLEFIPYRSPLFTHTVIELSVNGIKPQTFRYDNQGAGGIIIMHHRLPLALIKDWLKLDISLTLMSRRQPQFESGTDVRSLGIALISAVITQA